MDQQCKQDNKKTSGKGDKLGQQRQKRNPFWLVIIWTIRLVLFPILIPLWYIPKGIWWINKQGWKSIDNNFFSFIRGEVKRDEKTKKVKGVKFVTYNEDIHFHYCLWGGIICAIFAWAIPSIINILSVFIILLPIFSIVIVKYDFPFRKVWKSLVAIVILVPLADYGLYKGTYWLTSQTFPWLESNVHWLGITSNHIGGYEIGFVIVKCFEAFNLQVSAGTFLFMALAWGLFITGTILESWAYERYELTENASELHNYRLFTSTETTPVYMRKLEIVIKDVFEVFPFAFATLKVQTKNGVENLPNIPWLAFGKFAQSMKELISAENFSTDEEKKKQVLASDAADEVPDQDVGHGDGDSEQNNGSDNEHSPF